MSLRDAGRLRRQAHRQKVPAFDQVDQALRRQRDRRRRRSRTGRLRGCLSGLSRRRNAGLGLARRRRFRQRRRLLRRDEDRRSYCIPRGSHVFPRGCGGWRGGSPLDEGGVFPFGVSAPFPAFPLQCAAWIRTAPLFMNVRSQVGHGTWFLILRFCFSVIGVRSRQDQGEDADQSADDHAAREIGHLERDHRGVTLSVMPPMFRLPIAHGRARGVRSQGVEKPGQVCMFP